MSAKSFLRQEILILISREKKSHKALSSDIWKRDFAYHLSLVWLNILLHIYTAIWYWVISWWYIRLIQEEFSAICENGSVSKFLLWVILNRNLNLSIKIMELKWKVILVFYVSLYS